MNPKIVDWSGKRVWLVGASSGIGADPLQFRQQLLLGLDRVRR